MNRLFRSVVCAAAAMAVLSFSVPAFSETPSFQELIAQAKEAFDEGDFDTAIKHLVDANRMRPNSRLLLNIARSYAKTDDCASAAAYYWAYFNAPDAEAELVDVAEHEFDDLECDAYDPEASGRVVFDSSPPGARVSLGGEVLGTTPFEAVQLPSGTQTFKFDLEGRQTVEESVSIGARQLTRITVRLPEVVVEPEPAEPEPVVIEPHTQEEDLAMVYVASGVTVVGVGLFVVGMIYDLSVIPSTDDERSLTERGSARYNELTDQRSSQSTIALVSYITGGVLAVGGGAWLTYLLLADSDEHVRREGAGISIAPQIGVEAVGVGLSGRF